MNLPNDPAIILGIVNTKLRDFYSSLDELCDDMNINKTELINKLKTIGYEYNSERNAFV